jgi:hypothetical protein
MGAPGRRRARSGSGAAERVAHGVKVQARPSGCYPCGRRGTHDAECSFTLN